MLLRALGWPNTLGPNSIKNAIDVGAVQMGVTTQDMEDIATAILDRATSSHVTAGTVGKAVGDTVVDTENIQTRLPTALVGSRMDASVGAINNSASAAVNLALAAGVMVAGAVENTGFSPTTTEFETDDVTEATADHYIGRVVIFTSGALLNQQASITDYALSGGRGHFTVSLMTDAPADGDTFLIV